LSTLAVPSRPSARLGDEAPRVLHLVHRFDTGGLENGVVNLIDHMPAFRHAVVALTEVAPGFAGRVRRGDVEFISLHKPPGHGVRVYPALGRLLRQWRPAVVHTRNLAALECQPVAALAGVPVRIHGEHGRDAEDPRGARLRYRLVRRLYRPFVHHYVALGGELASYLEQSIGVPRARIASIVNGVDVERFRPAAGGRTSLVGCPFDALGLFVIGTVGRMQTVKAQPLLARAFVRALELAPHLRQRLRLAMIGDGPLRRETQAVLAAGGVDALAWLPGERTDVPDVMRGLDCFVLPSIAEGISNTILEAMASGLPVLATAVGGNGELVEDGQTGALVPAGDIEAMAAGIVRMASDPAHAAVLGRAGRARAEARFSLPAMVGAYQALYERLLAERSITATQA
jgi:sugar transferase (PEP-CTERM/EpsH1 system associated)